MVIFGPELDTGIGLARGDPLACRAGLGEKARSEGATFLLHAAKAKAGPALVAWDRRIRATNSRRAMSLA